MKMQENQALLEILNKCAMDCHHCSTACLEEDDVSMLTKCIKLDLDCSAICQLTAAFIARGSQNANKLLQICAELCDACAEECEKHQHMEHCKRCAESCRECAKACRSAMA